MNHDVFISYSSRNKATALAICHVLEEHRIRCWMAPRDIPVGADYGDVIDEAIVACRLFVLVFSEPASLSQWVKGELNLAFTEKKIILPYRIDAAPLKGAMRLILNQMHWVEAYPDAEAKFGELVESAARFLGRAEVGASRTETVAPQPASAPARCYKVGDYYDENGKQGVVFEVDASGLHGKIVGMKETKTMERLKWGPLELLTGAVDMENGMNNQRAIERIDGWREKYPAFAWCAAQGEGWYLPAVEELGQLFAIRDVINRMLERQDGIKLDGFYWSSSEDGGRPCAWDVNMRNGGAGSNDKYNALYVRAVSAF